MGWRRVNASLGLRASSVSAMSCRAFETGTSSAAVKTRAAQPPFAHDRARQAVRKQTGEGLGLGLEEPRMRLLCDASLI